MWTYSKWKAERELKKAATRMSPLGMELLEALREDEWTADEYTIKHVKSGIQLWTANSAEHFRVYTVPNGNLRDAEKEKLLTDDDRLVLYPVMRQLRRKVAAQPADIALNILRLGRMKGDSNV